MELIRIDGYEEICCCGHHRDDHGPECVGDGRNCGCPGFNPMEYRPEDESERERMLRAMQNKKPTDKQVAILENNGLKIPKTRADAFLKIEEMLGKAR
jgi:hypothetical protein